MSRKFGRVMSKLQKCVARIKPKLVPVIENLSSLNCIRPSGCNTDQHSTKKTASALETGKFCLKSSSEMFASIFLEQKQYSKIVCLTS